MKEYRFDPGIQLDFKSLIPLRVQIYEQMRNAVIRNRVKPGTRVISESQIVNKHSVNRKTVHLAYQELIDCGLFECTSPRSGVRIAPGAGTFYQIYTPSIALVLPFSFEKHIHQNDFGWMEYVGGIFDRAADLKYSVNLVHLPPPFLNEKEIRFFRDDLLSRSIGIITMGSRESMLGTGICRSIKEDLVLQSLIECKEIPHVFLNGGSCFDHISTVTADVTVGISKMLAYFRENNVKSLCLLSVAPMETRQFLYKYATRMKEVDHLAQKEGFSTVALEFTEKDLARPGAVARRYLAMKQAPEVVFCSNDALGCRFIDEMKQQGYEIPRDVKVVGYDNIAPGSCSLSSVWHNRLDLGGAAVDLIHELSCDSAGRCSGHKTIATSFVLRESSRF